MSGAAQHTHDETRPVAGQPPADELARLAQALGTARKLVDVFRGLRVYVEAVTGGNGLFVSLLDAERQHRQCVYAWGDGEEIDVSGLPPLPMSGGPHARAVATGQVIIVEDLQATMAKTPHVHLGQERDPRAPSISIALPLAVLGRVIGGFEVQIFEHPNPRACVPPLQVAANLAAAAIENVRLLETERELRRAAEASERRYRASEERLRLALEATGLGTWDLDLRMGRFRWSPGSGRLFGQPGGPPPRTWSDLLARIDADDRPRVEEALGRLWHAPGTQEVEFRLARTTGGIRWLACRAHARAEASNAPTHLSGVVLDITSRTEAERQREALARSEQLRALGQMASGIAHDLNQSLALISGHAELARKELTAQPPDLTRTGELLDVIVRATHEGAGTLRQLLAFTRAQQAESLRPLDLGGLLREVADLTAPRWRGGAHAARPIHLEMDIASGAELIIDAAPAMLREAFTNLIFNAVDALPAGGTIRLRATRQGDRVVAEVSDTGTGIPSEVRSRIFEPFFTTKGEHGTGLGLAQVAGVVARHGGEIDVESAPGRGTTFRLIFPAARAPAASVAPPPKPARAAHRPRRVLVVDDEARLRDMVAMMLRPAGHEVSVAGSGEEALALMEAQPVDVVISDVSMGEGMSGWDVAERVRARWPDVVVVLATGWGAQVPLEEAQARGVAAVLAKPYQMAELRELVASVGRSD